MHTARKPITARKPPLRSKLLSARKLVSTVVVVAIFGGIAGSSTFSAFTSTTTSSGNSFTAGSVTIGDNDAGAALYSLSNQRPGVTTSKCIKVTYGGSLGATVKLYTPSTLASGAQYDNLTITPGTQATSTFPDCTGFVAAGGAIFNGTLQGFATAHNNFATGLALNDQGGSTTWNANDAVVYRLDVSIQNVAAAQGTSSGAHDFTWQAENK